MLSSLAADRNVRAPQARAGLLAPFPACLDLRMFHQASPIPIAGLLAGLLSLCSCVHRFAPEAPGVDQVMQLPSRLEGKFFVIETTIGGLGPFQMLFDTGASLTVLSPEIAGQLNHVGALDEVRKVPVNTSLDERTRFDLVRIENLQLGGFHMPKASAIVADMHFVSTTAGRKIDGLIGMELFRNCQLIVDYPKGTLNVAPVDAAAPEGSLVMLSRFPRLTPEVSLNLGSAKVPVMIDTGASGGFNLPESKLKDRLASPSVGVGTQFSINRIEEARAARLNESIFLGGVLFEQPITFVSRSSGGIIGAEVLQHFVVGLNQARQQIWFQPHGDRTVPRPPSIKDVGLDVAWDATAYRITRVASGSDAAQAGVRPGDRITKIGRRPASDWSDAQIRHMIMTLDTIVFEVTRGAEVRAVRLSTTAVK
jgi:hypothetical protein